MKRTRALQGTKRAGPNWTFLNRESSLHVCLCVDVDFFILSRWMYDQDVQDVEKEPSAKRTKTGGIVKKEDAISIKQEAK